MNKIYDNRGFSLLEVLIYSGIITGFITFTILSAYQMIEYGGRLEKQRELNENQRFLVQKLHWALSNVQTVNSPALGGTGATLSVDKIGFGSNPIVIDAVNGAVRMSLGGGASVTLNNRFASTTNLIFDYQNFYGEGIMKVTADLSNDVATTSINTNIFVR